MFLLYSNYTQIIVSPHRSGEIYLANTSHFVKFTSEVNASITMTCVAGTLTLLSSLLGYLICIEYINYHYLQSTKVENYLT